ncbi:MAG: hypothetical protein N2712_05030 [Brevinematales bacterium]|nr:hypothetical protein [Brevinematales bacterium]
MRGFSLVLVLFLCLGMVFAQEDAGISLSGRFRTDVGISTVVSNNRLESYYYLGKNTLRIEFVNNDTTYGKVDGSIDFNIVLGRYYNVLLSQTNAILLGDSALLLVDLRKLYLMVRFGWGDIIVGRQLLRFGQGVVFSPINFFDRLDISDINFSRVGSDCLRIRVFLSDMGDISLVVVPRAIVTNSDALLRTSFMLAGFDMEGVLGYFGLNNEIRSGLSFKGDIGLGIYGEFLYNYHEEPKNRYFEFALGLDYSFFERLVTRCEYYFNSLDTEGVLPILLTRHKTYPFVSRQYLMLQLSYLHDIVTSASLSLIENIEKEGFIAYLGVTKNLFQNVDFYLDVRFFYKDIGGFFGIIGYNLIYSSLGLEMKF